MVLAGPQVLSTLWAELQLGAVAALLAAAAHVGWRTEVDLEPPELGKGAITSCGLCIGAGSR